MTRTALVTGGNRGIGQQVARVLAGERWDVLIGARDRQKADATAARLRKETGGRLKAVELDVTSDASVAGAAQKLRDGAIRIDALVNNAGVYGAARGPESIEPTIETNFFGPLRVTLGLLPLLRDGATVTNVTSGLGALENSTRLTGGCSAIPRSPATSSRHTCANSCAPAVRAGARRPTASRRRRSTR
jgi:NAD(P)-dependent dehydrogenase (short-subunit alcohol dehydrogenase family)